MGIVSKDDKDSSITYTGQWLSKPNPNSRNGTTHETTVTGANAVLKFKGSSVSVFGIIPRFAATTTVTNFSMNGFTQSYKAVSDETYILYDRNFYTSPELDPSEEHNLTITLVETGGNAFILDYFLVTEKDSSPSTASQTKSAATPSSSSKTSSTAATGKLPRGTVVAIAVESVVAAILLIIGIALLLWAKKLRRTKAKNEVVPDQQVTAFRSPAEYRYVPKSESATHFNPPPDALPDSPPFGWVDPRSGYLVRGGMSREKTLPNPPHGRERQNGGENDSSDGRSVALPAYQSVIGETMARRPASPLL